MKTFKNRNVHVEDNWLATQQWLLRVLFRSIMRNGYLSAQWQILVGHLLMIGDVLYPSSSVNVAPP